MRPLPPDGLWAEIAPLLPLQPAEPMGSRTRTSHRAALIGILLVLRSSTAWGLLPREKGCRSGMTFWRRLRDWQTAGVWDCLQQGLLDRLGRQNGIDFSRASLDSAAIAARRGLGDGAEPDRSRQAGHEAHGLTDTEGIPLAPKLTVANEHDSRMLEAFLDAVQPIRQCWGRPRKRPSKLHADKAYDHHCCRRALTRRRIQHRIARRGIECSQRVVRHRWVVERALAWVAQFRRLAIRNERRAETHLAFSTLAAALIVWHFIEPWSCQTLKVSSYLCSVCWLASALDHRPSLPNVARRAVHGRGFSGKRRDKLHPMSHMA